MQCWCVTHELRSQLLCRGGTNCFRTGEGRTGAHGTEWTGPARARTRHHQSPGTASQGSCCGLRGAPTRASDTDRATTLHRRRFRTNGASRENRETRPRLASEDKEHVYTIEGTVSGDVSDTHVARIRFHADKYLHVMRRMQDTFQHLECQAEFNITRLV